MNLDTSEIESGLQPDAPDDLSRLDQMIASDEAADAAKAAEKSRDEQGRFKPGASAKNAQRAGERQTPEEISARDARQGDEGKATNDQQQQADKAKQQQQNQQQQGDDKAGKTDDGKGKPDPDEGKSAYRRETERRDRSWQELNRQKEEFKKERDEFELHKQTVTQREQSLRRVPRINGYTAEQYEAAAPRFEAKAQEFEQAGDFDKADEQRRLAENAKAAAADLRKQSPGTARTAEQSWQTLKTDLPEALNPANPLNQELRALITQRPDLLADEAGPFRVAVIAGRKLVGTLEKKLQAASTEAARVPQLQAEVDRLSARVKELEGMTSPGGEGGGSAANRGQQRAKTPDQMTTTELEQSIERDLAQAY